MIFLFKPVSIITYVFLASASFASQYFLVELHLFEKVLNMLSTFCSLFGLKVDKPRTKSTVSIVIIKSIITTFAKCKISTLDLKRKFGVKIMSWII